MRRALLGKRAFAVLTRACDRHTCAVTKSPRKAIHNELKILKDVKSGFIVKYYGAFVETSQQEVHIFMEYMDGGSFAALLPRVGRFPEDVVARVAHGSASGLSYLLEKHNAIHRDIKPGNILVNTAGAVKICDFGTARVMENVEKQAITFIGTMVYMSPERVEGRTHGSAGDVCTAPNDIGLDHSSRFSPPQQHRTPAV